MTFQHDTATVNALKNTTGFTSIQCRTDEVDEKGDPVYSPGYWTAEIPSAVQGEGATKTYRFHNEKGQDCFVPAARVEEFLTAPASKKG